VIRGGALVPEAVGQDAVVELELQAALAVEGRRGELLVLQAEGHRRHSRIVPRLPVADPRIIATDCVDHFSKELALDGRAVLRSEAPALVDQIIAPGHADDRARLVQCLGEDTGRRVAELVLHIMQRVGEVLVRIGQEYLPRLLRIGLVAGEGVSETELLDPLPVAAVDA